MHRLVYPEAPVVLIDDEEIALNSMELILKSDNITNTLTMKDSSKALHYVRNNPVSVILLDLIMPNVKGMDILTSVKADFPHIPIIVVTGETDLQTAIDCMKNGAFDYILKPLDKNQLIKSIRHAIEYRNLHIEYIDLKDRFFKGRIENPDAFKAIVTNNEKMKKIFQYMEAIARTNKPVLITGETGVGKELIADALHILSELPGALISENVSGQSDEMFSDTFFGHIKGSYTGAMNDRPGLVESARDGTLFLDEIGDLSLESQIKLLRLLQENVYRPLGSDVLKRAGARIIAATNQDLVALQEQNKFRKDLYYRFMTHRIHIPPLRERKDDIPLLLEYFLEKASRELGKQKPTIPRQLVNLLQSYHFPGNIRELEAMIFNALSMHSGPMLSMDSFKQSIRCDSFNETADTNESPFEITGAFPTLKESDEFLIKQALKLSDNNLSIAASMLGISRQALSKRLKRNTELQ